MSRARSGCFPNILEMEIAQTELKLAHKCGTNDTKKFKVGIRNGADIHFFSESDEQFRTSNIVASLLKFWVLFSELHGKKVREPPIK